MGNEQTTPRKGTPFNPYVLITIESICSAMFDRRATVDLEILGPSGPFEIVPGYAQVAASIPLSEKASEVRLDVVDGSRSIRFTVTKQRFLNVLKLSGKLRLRGLDRDTHIKKMVRLRDERKRHVADLGVSLFYAGAMTQQEELLRYARDRSYRQAIFLTRQSSRDKSLERAHSVAIAKVVDFVNTHRSIFKVDKFQTTIVDRFLLSIACRFRFKKRFIQKSLETPLEPAEKHVFSVLVPPSEVALSDEVEGPPRIRNVVEDVDQLVAGVLGIVPSDRHEELFRGKLRVTVSGHGDDDESLFSQKDSAELTDGRAIYNQYRIAHELSYLRFEVSRRGVVTKSVGSAVIEMTEIWEQTEDRNRMEVELDLKSPDGTKLADLQLDFEKYSSEVKDLSDLKPRIRVQQFRGGYDHSDAEYLSSTSTEGSAELARGARALARRFIQKYNDQIRVYCIDECSFLKYDFKRRTAIEDEQTQCVDCVKVWYRITARPRGTVRKKSAPTVDITSDPFDF